MLINFNQKGTESHSRDCARSVPILRNNSEVEKEHFGHIPCNSYIYVQCLLSKFFGWVIVRLTSHYMIYIIVE